MLLLSRASQLPILIWAITRWCGYLNTAQGTVSSSCNVSVNIDVDATPPLSSCTDGFASVAWDVVGSVMMETNVDVLDIVILIDESGSVYNGCGYSSTCYNQEKTFAKNLVLVLDEYIGLFANGGQAGYIQFASKVNDYGMTKDVTTWSRSIDDLQMRTGGTAIGTAMKQALAMLTAVANGSQHQQVIILLTDGQENRYMVTNRNDPEALANEARAYGIEVFAVGIEQCGETSCTNKAELVAIAGTEDNVYTLNLFEDLTDEFIDELLDSVETPCVTGVKMELSLADGALPVGGSVTVSAGTSFSLIGSLLTWNIPAAGLSKQVLEYNVAFSCSCDSVGHGLQLYSSVSYQDDASAVVDLTSAGESTILRIDDIGACTYPSPAPSPVLTLAPVSAMKPTAMSTVQPTLSPSSATAILPTVSPVPPTLSPMASLTSAGTLSPALSLPPTLLPILSPNILPTLAPTLSLNVSPTISFTLSQTHAGTLSPTPSPTVSPTVSPISSPINRPSLSPAHPPVPESTHTSTPAPAAIAMPMDSTTEVAGRYSAFQGTLLITGVSSCEENVTDWHVMIEETLMKLFPRQSSMSLSGSSCIPLGNIRAADDRTLGTGTRRLRGGRLLGDSSALSAQDSELVWSTTFAVLYIDSPGDALSLSASARVSEDITTGFTLYNRFIIMSEVLHVSVADVSLSSMAFTQDFIVDHGIINSEEHSAAQGALFGAVNASVAVESSGLDISCKVLTVLRVLMPLFVLWMLLIIYCWRRQQQQQPFHMIMQEDSDRRDGQICITAVRGEQAAGSKAEKVGRLGTNLTAPFAQLFISRAKKADEPIVTGKPQSTCTSGCVVACAFDCYYHQDVSSLALDLDAESDEEGDDNFAVRRSAHNDVINSNIQRLRRGESWTSRRSGSLEQSRTVMLKNQCLVGILGFAGGNPLYRRDVNSSFGSVGDVGDNQHQGLGEAERTGLTIIETLDFDNVEDGEEEESRVFGTSVRHHSVQLSIDESWTKVNTTCSEYLGQQVKK